MLRKSMGLAVMVSVLFAAPAWAQVRDADYRGTLVCGKLPFAHDPARTAITVQIAGNQGSYERPVQLTRQGGKSVEKGTAKVDGDKITLAGSWKDEKGSYEASYGGTFVRRSAKLTGTQTWSYDGKSYKRECSGAIKRPFAAFLPKQKKPAQ
jgi:hypothetical protein